MTEQDCRPGRVPPDPGSPPRAGLAWAESGSDRRIAPEHGQAPKCTTASRAWSRKNFASLHPGVGRSERNWRPTANGRGEGDSYHQVLATRAYRVRQITLTYPLPEYRERGINEHVSPSSAAPLPAKFSDLPSQYCRTMRHPVSLPAAHVISPRDNTLMGRFSLPPRGLLASVRNSELLTVRFRGEAWPLAGAAAGRVNGCAGQRTGPHHRPAVTGGTHARWFTRGAFPGDRFRMAGPGLRPQSSK